MIARAVDGPMPGNDSSSARLAVFRLTTTDATAVVALGVDVIAPEGYGEVIGGGQREDSYEVLVRKIDEHKLPIEAFSWFLDLRKYGTVPHGGFGLGLERLVTWVCGIHHIRETIPFPRTIDRLVP